MTIDEPTGNFLMLFERVCLAIFTLVATLKVHAYWRLPVEQQLGRSRIFTANLAIVGGLLLVAAGGGNFALAP